MNIRKIREKLVMTQAELATALQVSGVIVSLWELGKVKISPKNQRKIIALCKRKKINYDD